MTSPARLTVLSQLTRDVRAKLDHRRGRTSLPWMKSRELDIIEEALATLNPARCLEWGAGYSTLHFPPGFRPSQAGSRSSTMSLGSSKSGRCRPTRGCPLSRFRRTTGQYPNTRKEGTYEDFRSYVDYPTTEDGPFDFIFIDGRARVACLDRAYQLVTDRGLVILHDANRPNYVESLPPFAHLLRLTDYRRNRGGILLASRGRPIGEFIDMETHRRLWRGHDRLAWWLRMR